MTAVDSPIPASARSAATTACVTPRRRDPEGRRRAILTAAAELIVENGPDSLTHRAIAARARVSLGSTTQYFASIDELRDAALQQLADEIDESLVHLDSTLADLETAPERVAAEMHAFLSDQRQVQADIALISSGATDPRLRELALRWFNRLVELLEDHIGHERATAIAVYVDGATLHAALHGRPLDASEIAAAIRALAGLPEAVR